MSRSPTINFELSIMLKRLAKHISTIVSLKITTKKIHVYIYIRRPWNETSVSIWEFEMMIVIKWQFCLHLIRYMIKFTEHKWNWINLINSVTLICLWILAFPIGIIEFSTSRKCCFDFISVPYTITDFQAPETL